MPYAETVSSLDSLPPDSEQARTLTPPCSRSRPEASTGRSVFCLTDDGALVGGRKTTRRRLARRLRYGTVCTSADGAGARELVASPLGSGSPRFPSLREGQAAPFPLL